MSLKQNEAQPAAVGQAGGKEDVQLELRKAWTRTIEMKVNRCLEISRLTPLTGLKKTILASDQAHEIIMFLVELLEDESKDHETRFGALLLLMHFTYTKNKKELTQEQVEVMAIAELLDHSSKADRSSFIRIVEAFLQRLDNNKELFFKLRKAKKEREEDGGRMPAARLHVDSLFQLYVLEQQRMAVKKLCNLGVEKEQAAKDVDSDCHSRCKGRRSDGNRKALKGLSGYNLYCSPTLFGSPNSHAHRRGLSKRYFDAIQVEASVHFFIGKACYNACESLPKARRDELKRKGRAVPGYKIDSVSGPSADWEFSSEDELQEAVDNWVRSLEARRQSVVTRWCHHMENMGYEDDEISYELIQKLKAAKKKDKTDAEIVTMFDSEC